MSRGHDERTSAVAAGAPRSARLIGRAAELARLHTLLGEDGGTLVIAGRSGIGKSALMSEALADAAAVAQRRVLRATGMQSHAAVPFSSLAELLAPVAEDIDALPPIQRLALRAALHLEVPEGLDRGTVVRALGALVGRLAPLVIAIDDAQWLDASSRDAVTFVARRAARLKACVIAVHSQRVGSVEAESMELYAMERGAMERSAMERGAMELRAMDGWADLPTLELRDLGRADALALATRCGVAPGAAEQLVDAVGGNPMALVDGASDLTPGQRDGTEPLPALPSAGARITAAYGARLARLPADTRAAMLLAAAGDGASAPLALALAARGRGPDGMGVFGPAEDDGLIVLAPQAVRFAHPEVRLAVYHGATPSERRAAHRALAEVLPDPDRAWHLAVAAEQPDEDIAAALERSAQDAIARGAPASGLAALARAAQMTPDPERSRRRTLAAGRIALLVGRPLTALSLAGGLPPTADPIARADTQLVIGAAHAQAGRLLEARALLESEADRVAAADSGRAAMLLAQATTVLSGTGPIEDLAQMAQRITLLLPPGDDVVAVAAAAMAHAALGEHELARAALLGRLDEIAALDQSEFGYQAIAAAAMALNLLEEQDKAMRLMTPVVHTLRERGAVAPLAVVLVALADIHRRRGDLIAARALAQEALDVGEGAVAGLLLATVLNTVASAAAHLDEDERCLSAAREALVISNRLGSHSGSMLAEHALGMLALRRGDVEVAIGHLERAREHQRRYGVRDPGFACVEGDLTEAYVRAGRLGDAAGSLGQLRAGALLTGGAWAAAAAARYAAMLGPDEDIDGHLAAAMAALERGEFGFEAARTRLVFGERLRRARRRVEARGLLAEAEADFRARGAAGWADRAAAELVATGGGSWRGAGAARGRRSSGVALDLGGLTARERDVAVLVAGGATNPEVAAALFVSRRTVEHHLRQIYRKLDIRSRSELAARLAGGRG